MKKQTLLIASVCVIAAGGIGTLLLHRPKPEALCGTWQLDHEDAGETLTLYNDLTYVLTWTTYLNDEVRSHDRTGTWELDGSTLRIDVPAAGTVSEYRVSLRNDVMTWKERLPNGETDIREYQRRD